MRNHKLKNTFVLLLALILTVSTLFASASCVQSPFGSPSEENNSSIVTSSSSELSSESPGSHEPGNEMTVRFLDVGQADCTLIQLEGNKFVLIDAGRYDDKISVINALNKYGVKSIEYAVFTHMHADHIGAAANVINGYNVKNVVMPDATATSRTYEDMITALEEHSEINIIEGKAGLKFSVADAEFEVLSPVSTLGCDANETSVVVLMKYIDISMIFMGDAEKTNELSILNRYEKDYIKADVIKIGHHGSYTSSSEAFLRAVDPEYAIIMCGKDNSYNHPHTETIDTLNKLAIKIRRTDKEGTITVKTNGVVMDVSNG